MNCIILRGDSLRLEEDYHNEDDGDDGDDHDPHGQDRPGHHGGARDPVPVPIAELVAAVEFVVPGLGFMAVVDVATSDFETRPKYQNWANFINKCTTES